MKEVKFVKAVASGNDFIIIERFKPQDAGCRLKLNRLAKELCQRKFSVGADGLLVIERSKKADLKMRVFNPDGSEVKMCGNGARCVALYAYRRNLTHRGELLIETKAGNLAAKVKRDTVKLRMSVPKELRLKFALNIEGKTQEVSSINTGVPHVVSFVRRLADYDVRSKGKAIREHLEFQPEGTNANFVQVLDGTHLRVRTYERGVEDETLACGTGCVASAIIATYSMEPEPQGRHKIYVDTQSGERLIVYFRIEQGNVEEVYLEGKARIVYRGGVDV